MKRTVISEFNDQELVYNHLCYENISWNEISPQTHDVFEMIYVKEGNFSYLIEEKAYQVKKNSLILTEPGKMHNMKFHNFDVYDRYDVFFEDESILPSILKKLPLEINVINLNDYPAVLDLFLKMDFYCENFSGNELKNILNKIVEEVLYNIIYITQRFQNSNSNGTYTANPLIAQAVDYIGNHLCENLSLETLCNELFISKSQLHQIFERHMQISPRKYIIEKRLVSAQRMIRLGERPTNIYSLFTFKDYSSFYRAYKKHFGYPPSMELNHKALRKIEF